LDFGFWILDFEVWILITLDPNYLFTHLSNTIVDHLQN
jgi:hypothetical protein